MKSRSGTPTALIVAIGILVVAFLISQTNLFKPVRNLATYILTPIQDQVTQIADTISLWAKGGREIVTLREENRELRAQVDRLSVEMLHLEEATKEIEQLRSLLEFKRIYPSYQFRGSEVVGRPVAAGATNLFTDLILDVGARDGIETNMPVVTDRGLVGRVLEVYPTACRVLLIVDVRSSVNAMIQRNRVAGLVEGRPGGKLVMTDIPHDATVAEGDVVLTSGLGGMFPKALIIGQVTKVHRSDVELFQEAEIQPTVDFAGIERVLVVTSFTQPTLPEDTVTP